MTNEEPVQKKRGRKPKSAFETPPGNVNASYGADMDVAPPPRKRGRPPKNPPALEAAVRGTFEGEPKNVRTPEDEDAGRWKGTARKSGAERLYALDIGTRSVIGIAAERGADGIITITDTERREHKTRAMLDGQIHDVPEVAALIREVTSALAGRGELSRSVAVAAAGRSLYTMTAEASAEFGGTITDDDERRLDFAGVQAAQSMLEESGEIDDPTRYYCVGYSTIKYTLDGNQLRTLVGQRGKRASATVIATFLPRQVIDSMDSALSHASLELKAITLEPIAAINVLIPPTMRHLNLVLVDIGAGTSDVAVTKNGSVIAYGMVPQAGDEITEEISKQFLLDFNVAEQVKRDATHGKGVDFDDILGCHYSLSAEEIMAPLEEGIRKLAGAIASQVMKLNGEKPQAVLLVGGGSLTPGLAGYIAEELELPKGRVAVRHPETIEGIESIPEELKAPDAVTPLGILKIASLSTLHLLTVYVMGTEYRLFNFRALTVSDALLTAGVQLKRFNGKPGLGIRVKIDDHTRFFPGTMGSLARLTLNGEEAGLDAPIEDGARIDIIAGDDGDDAVVTPDDIEDLPGSYTIFINGRETELPPQILVNDKTPEASQQLNDGDVIKGRPTRSVGEALKAAGYSPTGKKIHYILNDSESQCAVTPSITLNGEPATLSMEVHAGDGIGYSLPEAPTLGEVLDIDESDANLTIYFNGTEYTIPSSAINLEVDGRSATTDTLVTEGCSVVYDRSDRRMTLVNSALLAVGFEPPSATSGMLVDIRVNGENAKFNDPIKNGDRIDVDVRLASGVAARQQSSEYQVPPAPKVDENGLKDGLLSDYLAGIERDGSLSVK